MATAVIVELRKNGLGVDSANHKLVAEVAAIFVIAGVTLPASTGEIVGRSLHFINLGGCYCTVTLFLHSANNTSCIAILNEPLVDVS